MSQQVTNQANNIFALPFQTEGAAQSSGSVGSVSSAANVVGTGVPALVLNSQGQFVPANTESDTLPSLPDVTGARAGGDQSQLPVASWLQMKPGSLSQALGMLADMASDNMMTMQKIRTEAASNEYMTQEQSANEMVKQVEGERSSSWTKFAGSLVAGVASIGLGARGGWLSTRNESWEIKWGATLQAAGTTVGQVVNSATDLVDKTAGGQYQADQAKIAKAYLDMLVTIFKSQDESFNSEVQNAQKSLQNVWDLKRSVADQTSQTLINTNSNV